MNFNIYEHILSYHVQTPFVTNNWEHSTNVHKKSNSISSNSYEQEPQNLEIINIITMIDSTHGTHQPIHHGFMCL